MQAGKILNVGLMVAFCLVAAGCEEGTGHGSKGFRNQYTVARGALEAGKYDTAINAYRRLIPNAGPLQPRIRLEYAHTLLRANKYAEAAEEARSLASTQKGDARSAALAVQGTAQHELALSAINKGEDGTQLLKAADAALSEVLKKHPEMDPLGALKQRRKNVRQLARRS